MCLMCISLCCISWLSFSKSFNKELKWENFFSHIHNKLFGSFISCQPSDSILLVFSIYSFSYERSIQRVGFWYFLPKWTWVNELIFLRLKCRRLIKKYYITLKTMLWVKWIYITQKRSSWYFISTQYIIAGVIGILQLSTVMLCTFLYTSPTE